MVHKMAEWYLPRYLSLPPTVHPCHHQYASKFGKLISGHRTGKGQISFQSQRKAMPKECSNYCPIAHTSKIMLKILQVRLQQYVNQ